MKHTAVCAHLVPLFGQASRLPGFHMCMLNHAGASICCWSAALRAARPAPRMELSMMGMNMFVCACGLDMLMFVCACDTSSRPLLDEQAELLGLEPKAGQCARAQLCGADGADAVACPFPE